MLAAFALTPFSVIGTTGFGDSAYVIEQSRNLAFEVFTSAVTTETLRQKFERLADTWEKETILLSNIDQIQSNPSYLRIIAMGNDILPLIFNKMRSNPDYWFAALNAMTGINPVQENERGNIQAMTDAWLAWARKNGYVVA